MTYFSCFSFFKRYFGDRERVQKKFQVEHDWVNLFIFQIFLNRFSESKQNVRLSENKFI